MSRSCDALPPRPVRTSLVALVAAMSMLFTGIANGAPLHSRAAARHGSKPAHSHALRSQGSPATPFITGQVSAHGGKFYLGTTPIVLHGKKAVVETKSLTQALQS